MLINLLYCERTAWNERTNDEQVPRQTNIKSLNVLYVDYTLDRINRFGLESQERNIAATFIRSNCILTFGMFIVVWHPLFISPLKTVDKFY
jgi:hypothetical protein